MIQIKDAHPFRRILGRQTGFTLFELMVVVCIAGVVATVLAERLFYYQEVAEKAVFELILARTKMGLQIQMAELIMTRRQRQVVDLETENPMQWLEEPPANYAGEYSSVPSPGTWSYSTPEHELVYMPAHTAHLDVGTADNNELRFRVVIPMQADGATGSRTPAGVALRPVREYKWL